MDMWGKHKACQQIYAVINKREFVSITYFYIRCA